MKKINNKIKINQRVMITLNTLAMLTSSTREKKMICIEFSNKNNS